MNEFCYPIAVKASSTGPNAKVMLCGKELEMWNYEDAKFCPFCGRRIQR